MPLTLTITDEQANELLEFLEAGVFQGRKVAVERIQSSEGEIDVDMINRFNRVYSVLKLLRQRIGKGAGERNA